MKSSLKFAPLLALSALLILILTLSNTPITDSKIPQLIGKANLYNMQFPQEKVYLHLDRSSYWASDDIWFKAYLKDSPLPECNLYVELLSSKGKVVQKKMYWAQNGLAYGDFHLTDTIRTGVYQIRAYTNWMRNFDENWFFRKDVVIMNLRDKQVADESSQLKERQIDFQFFPEGGTFVASLVNKLAFKATDRNGKGLNVEGRILDDQGKEIVTFKSNFKGIGNFMIQPQEGRKYKAEVKIAGAIEMNVDLPVPEPNGVILAVNTNNTNQLHIQIAKKTIAATDNLTADYTLIGQVKGVVFYRKEIAMVKDTFNLNINQQELPTGIIQFTLFDNNTIPVCERMVFINHHDFINVEIFPTKPIYLTHERVELDVEAFDRQGNPFMTNLSMSVYNPESQLKSEDYPNNILTHFLLGSELKGLIEEPGYYFKDDSLSTVASLDNLMLTHGYRHFEWDAIKADRFPAITYPAEECIQIRGTVKTILLRKPFPDCKVTMVSVKSMLSITEQTTDSLGEFLFSNLYFNDTTEYSLQAVNPKGKRNTEIELDDRSSISPKAGYLPSTYQYINSKPVNTTTYLNETNSDLINKKWHTSDTILLGDIFISGTKAIKDDGNVRIYGTADFVFDVAKQDNVYGNIFDLIEGRMPGVQLEGRNFYIRGNSKSAVLILDGVPIDPDFIVSIPVNSFDKIEVVKFAPMLGTKGINGAIFFYLKRGKQQTMINPDALGMKSAQIIGYSVMRKFYSPNYAAQLPTDKKNDFRSTLYWNPIVRTDSLGTAAVSFYNSDQVGDVEVIVEGVTSDGKLCRGVAKYKVTK